jgi:hypothetical protein
LRNEEIDKQIEHYLRMIGVNPENPEPLNAIELVEIDGIWQLPKEE